jgi:Cu2+-exporting ATPase
VVAAEGQLIAADGTVIKGVADVDQQRLTGESKLFEKSEGDRVFAGTTVLFGTLYIRVEQSGDETILARIESVLNQAANYKLELETRGARMTDRAALPTLAMAGLAWLGLGVTGALAIFGNYLCANLRILSPMNLLNALAQASHKGILVKDGRSLEAIAEIDTVVFERQAR